MRPRLPLLLGLLFLITLPRSAGAAISWRLMMAEIKSAIRACQEVKPRLDQDHLVTVYLERYGKVLEKAFSDEVEKPSLPRRLGDVLELLDSIDRVEFPGIYSVTTLQLSRGLKLLEARDIEEFSVVAREFWGGKQRRHAEKNVLQRTLIAEQFAALFRSRPDSHLELSLLALELFSREIDWMQRRSSKPVPLLKAVDLLKEPVATPSLYGLIDAMDEIHLAALKMPPPVPTELLSPMVAGLIRCLMMSEVRVKDRRGRLLEMTDPDSVAQSRLWVRAASLLIRMTARDDLVWYPDWEEFWSLYYGDKKVNESGFDFVQAWERARGIIGSGTVVGPVGKVDSNRFFGIEKRSSSFLIILDTSGSMVKNSRNINRLAVLQDEAIRFITQLHPGSSYNILPFSSECMIERSLSGGHGMLSKTRSRGKIDPEVEAWIRELSGGGATRSDLAFREAFGVKDGRVSKKFKPRFGEIYFITDGTPTYVDGKALKPGHVDLLLDMVSSLNARHRVVIHSIAFPGMGTRFLVDLAKRNQGQFQIIRDVEARAAGK